MTRQGISKVTMRDAPKDLLHEDLKVINIGLPEFAQSLDAQDRPVVQVDWAPPAAGDENLMQLLDEML